MRHAEAAWGGPDVGDMQRPLTELGRRQAQRQGEVLRDKGVERVICSSATRTRQTAELLGLDAPLTEAATLYNSAAGRIRTELASVPEYIKTVALVAHHPGVAELVRYLANDYSDRAALALIRYTYPPATLVGLEFTGLWPDLHSARLFLVKIPS
ncbi:MAG: histidine phosphatase family protein [Propionibacteriaceae bacterium]|jgi:phosphohistidine phosphatase|nr:histidine phosphatase family protein [Propionibacteriaceae bacterium]